MHWKGHAFFHAACSCGKFTCSYDKTSIETPDAYLRCAEKFKASGQWFVAVANLLVLLVAMTKLLQRLQMLT